MPDRRAKKSIDFKESSDSDDDMDTSTPEKEDGETADADNDEDKDDEEEEEEEFTVEAILNKRVTGGVTKYLIKWQGYNEDYNTWEPAENLYCDEILEEFERTWKEKRSGKAKAGKAGPKSSAAHSSASTSKNSATAGTRASSTTASGGDGQTPEADDLDHFDEDGKQSAGSLFSKKTKRIDLRPQVEGKSYGLDRGLEPRYIVGTIVNSKGKKFFLVIWYDNDEEGDMVPVDEFSEKFPEFTMSYLEGHRVWLPSPDYYDDEDDPGTMDTDTLAEVTTP